MKGPISKDRHHAPFEFIKGEIHSEFKRKYEPSLYNTKQHRTIQITLGWNSYHIIRSDKKEVLASIHLCVKKGIAYSPISAPYGFFEVYEDLSASILFDFISFFEKDLIGQRVKRIVIKSYPQEQHVKMHNMLTVLLFNHQYAVCNGELGALLKVNELSFEEKIDKWEKRKYKQAIKANLKFNSIPNKKLREVYQFISNCRKERGHDLSMSFDELNLTVSKLNDSFFCFGAYLDGKMVAASISIRESKSTFYNFYSAHNKESDSLSPMVFLIGELYTYCQKNKIRFLDLGTSALGGTPNFSLIDFKLRLGAIPSMKLTFEKELT